MESFVVFSKSRWDEPPRLRHQITRLLLAFGHQVSFFQRPMFLWEKSKTPVVSRQGDLLLVSTKQAIHHQLRIYRIIGYLNELVEIRSIRRKISSQINENVIVVNFNYDYAFLRKIFPENKIITVINDDFVAQAKLLKGRHVERALEETCKVSDCILTVSHPLMRQLSAWCKPVLFLPWSDGPYQFPTARGVRDAVLIWASINDVIDYELLRLVSEKLPHVHFLLVGPLSGQAKSIVPGLCAESESIQYSPSTSLESLALANVFAGLMPYREGVRSTEAVTLANKSLRLMSKGLPLVVHGMPNFLKHEAIFSCSGAEEMARQIEVARQNFYELQESMRDLVDNNGPAVRYREFMSAINNSR